jgi:4-hydroxy-3-methylbut-2-enyl diphosphate reductase
MRPGDVVVASEVRGPGGTVRCDGATALVEALERRGLRPRLGAVVSVDHLVQGQERARLLATGAIAADMESALLAGAVPAGGRFGVLRVVLDAPGRELKRPGLAAAAVRALRTLRRSAPAFHEWSAGNATTMQAASRNPDMSEAPVARALSGGHGGSELPPHGTGNRAEITPPKSPQTPSEEVI